jgi:hypothetical protein
MEMEYANPERKGQTVGMERLLRVGAWTVLARLDADLAAEKIQQDSATIAPVAEPHARPTVAGIPRRDPPK